MEHVLSNLPNEGASSSSSDDSNNNDNNSSSRNHYYTHDMSYTSFEDQMRVAREREQQRRKLEQKKKQQQGKNDRMHYSTSALMNTSCSSIQERMKKFQQPDPLSSKCQQQLSPSPQLPRSPTKIGKTLAIATKKTKDKKNDDKKPKATPDKKELKKQKKGMDSSDDDDSSVSSSPSSSSSSFSSSSESSMSSLEDSANNLSLSSFGKPDPDSSNKKGKQKKKKVPSRSKSAGLAGLERPIGSGISTKNAGRVAPSRRGVTKSQSLQQQAQGFRDRMSKSMSGVNAFPDFMDSDSSDDSDDDLAKAKKLAAAFNTSFSSNHSDKTEKTHVSTLPYMAQIHIEKQREFMRSLKKERELKEQREERAAEEAAKKKKFNYKSYSTPMKASSPGGAVGTGGTAKILSELPDEEDLKKKKTAKAKKKDATSTTTPKTLKKKKIKVGVVSVDDQGKKTFTPSPTKKTKPGLSYLEKLRLSRGEPLEGRDASSNIDSGKGMPVQQEKNGLANQMNKSASVLSTSKPSTKTQGKAGTSIDNVTEKTNTKDVVTVSSGNVSSPAKNIRDSASSPPSRQHTSVIGSTGCVGDNSFNASFNDQIRASRQRRKKDTKQLDNNASVGSIKNRLAMFGG